MRYIKIIIIIMSVCLVMGLTGYSATKGTPVALFGIIALYMTIVQKIEISMKSLYLPKKPTFFAKNYEIEDTIAKTVELFNRAEEYINIVSGRLRKEVYSNSDVLNALKDAIERNVNVEIVTEEEVDPVVMSLIENLIRTEKIYLFRLLDYKVSRHFTVIDGIDAKVQKKHDPRDEKIKAYFWYSLRRVGYQTKQKFEEIKKKAVQVTL